MSTSNRESRQMDEELKTKIRALVEEEPDAKERVKLMISSRIVEFMADNMRNVSKLVEEFQAHRAEFETHQTEYAQHLQTDHAIINQGKGAWKIGVVLLLLINTLIGTLYLNVVQDVASLKKDAVDSAIAIERLKVEATKGGTPNGSSS